MKDWIGKHKKEEIPIVVCLEATDIYHENRAYYLFERGFDVSIILPIRLKNIRSHWIKIQKMTQLT